MLLYLVCITLVFLLNVIFLLKALFVSFNFSQKNNSSRYTLLLVTLSFMIAAPVINSMLPNQDFASVSVILSMLGLIFIIFLNGYTFFKNHKKVFHLMTVFLCLYALIPTFIQIKFAIGDPKLVMNLGAPLSDTPECKSGLYLVTIPENRAQEAWDYRCATGFFALNIHTNEPFLIWPEYVNGSSHDVKNIAFDAITYMERNKAQNSN